MPLFEQKGEQHQSFEDESTITIGETMVDLVAVHGLGDVMKAASELSDHVDTLRTNEVESVYPEAADAIIGILKAKTDVDRGDVEELFRAFEELKLSDEEVRKYALALLHKLELEKVIAYRGSHWVAATTEPGPDTEPYF